MSVVLSCSNLSVSFGAFSALSGISLGFEEGRTTGLIGPNGAGKTTFLNALTGLQRATSGAIVLNGRDITGLPAHRRARIGMARSFQIVTVFPQMTVLENVQVARMRAHMKVAVPWRTIASFPEVGREALATIDRFGLSDVADVPAGTLSHGRQRALELAIVLVNEPRVLLLDEPLAGVGRAELDRPRHRRVGRRAGAGPRDAGGDPVRSEGARCLPWSMKRWPLRRRTSSTAAPRPCTMCRSLSGAERWWHSPGETGRASRPR